MRTGALTGTPTAPGTSSFTVTAADAAGDTGSRAYALTVAPSGIKPVVLNTLPHCETPPALYRHERAAFLKEHAKDGMAVVFFERGLTPAMAREFGISRRFGSELLTNEDHRRQS